MKENQPVTAVLIGAGNRGRLYGRYARKNESRLRFTALAEPIADRRTSFGARHGIPENRRFTGWKELLAGPKMAEAAFICTQDRMHTQAALQALERGYHVLLEKPMAASLEDCIRIVRKAEETRRKLAVCHVLRYTDFFSTMHRTVREGTLGRVMTVNHSENIAWYHFSHSYVRGEWGNSADSSPIILAKCCHDLDLIHWIVGSPPARISSFGRLQHFTAGNAPRGAPPYCVEGCPAQDSCLYYAPRIYIDIVPIIQIVKKSRNTLFGCLMHLREKHPGLLGFFSHLFPPLRYIRYWRWWPVSYLYAGQSRDYSDQGKWNILRSSPYGRCVYQTDNDVVDHQVVNIEFENGVTAHLTMHGFSEREGRYVRIDGTRATLIGRFDLAGEELVLYDHHSGTRKVLHRARLSARSIPHGGGDFRLVSAFLQSLDRKAKSLTAASEILESHLMAFASELSRKSGDVVDMGEFRRRAFTPSHA